MAVRPTPKTPAATPPGVAGGGAADPAPSLVPHGSHAGKPALPLHRPLILVGSRQRAHVHLISNSVSRVHAVIINTSHGSYVRDLASRTGTIVNGRHVKESGLRHSDTIQVGTFQFKFSDPTGRGPLSAAVRPPAALLHVQNREVPVAVEGRTVLIGQRDSCDIALRSNAVSTAHALVFELNGHHFVRDLGSRTGTYVNGRQIHQEALEVGDMIRVGETAIRYASAAPAEELEPLEMPAEEAAAAPIPVSAVIRIDEPPAVEEFANLEVTPEAEPLADEEVTATASAGATEPPDLETTWEPPAASPAQDFVPEAPADAVATTHAGYDPEPPATEEAAFPPPLPLAAGDNGVPVGHRDEQPATFDDIFGRDFHPSDHGSGRIPAALEQETGQSIPLDDLESAAADALPPLPLEDAEDLAGGTRHAPPPLPPSTEAPALEPEIDFEAESADSVSAAINEPFGPLTDLSLRLPDEPEPDMPAEPRPSLLDEIDLAPAEPHPAPLASETETEPPPTAEPLALEPMAPEPAELEPIASELSPTEPPAEPAADIPNLSAEPPFVQAAEVAEDIAPWPTPEAAAPAEPPHAADQPGQAATYAASDLADHGSPFLPESLAAAVPETSATFDPVMPEVTSPVDLEPQATDLEPAAEFVPTEAEPPADTIDTVSATIPADLDVVTPEVLAPIEPAAPSPEAEVSVPPPQTEQPSEVPADEPPAPVKKRGGRKVVAKKPAPAPSPAAPKKRRPWGKKAKEAEAAAEAAAVAAAAAAAGAAAAPLATAETEAAAAAAVETVAATPAPEATLDAPSDVAPQAAEAPEPAPEFLASSVAEVIEDAPASADPVADVSAEPPAPVAETLAPTEPSPESALELGLSEVETTVAGGGLADDVSMTASEPAAETPAELPPSDPAFDAMIDEFVGPSTGPIVEQAAEPEPAAVEPSAAASHEPPAQDEAPSAFTWDAPAEGATTATAATSPFEESSPLDLVDEPPAPPRELPTAETPAFDRPIVDSVAAEAPLEEVPAVEATPLADDGLTDTTPPAAATAPQPAPEPPSMFDPFMGMGRDVGSFIGGLPFDMAAPAPPPAPARFEEPSFTLPEEPQASSGSDAEPPPPEISFEPSALDEFAPPAPGEPEPAFDPLSLQSQPPPLPPEVGATADGNELDLTLPDLTLPELPELAPEPITPPAPLGPPPLPETASATAGEGLLEASALELSDLDLPPLEPPAPRGAGSRRHDDDQVDPLLFTEAESPTLQMLPRIDPAPQPPVVNRGAPAKPPTSPPGRGRPAPAPPPQSKYPPKPPPPARSTTPRRSAPRAPFDAGAGDIGAGLGMAGELTGLSGASAPPAGKGAGTAAHAFDGLALPVREADVFSGLPLGDDDPVLGGSKPGTPRKPVKRGPTGEAPGKRARSIPEIPPLEPLDPLPPLPPVGKRGRGAPVAPPRDEATPEDLVAGLAAHEPVAPAPPVPDARRAAPHVDHGRGHGWGDAATVQPPRRRRGIGLWLALMIVTLVGACAGILTFGPKPTSEVVGSLQFEGLRDLSEDRRNQFVREQREWLAQPRFRAQARELLLTKQSGPSAGFLGEDDKAVADYMAIVDKTHVKEGTNSLTLPYRGNDSEGDRARMDAVINALFTMNEPLKDASRQTQRSASDAERDLERNAADIEKAKQRVAQLREKADSVPVLEKKLQTLQAEDERLSRAAADARREVIRLRAEAGRPQSRGPVARPGGGVVVSLASLLLVPASAGPALEVAPATRPGADENDAELREWVTQLSQLEASIAAARADAVARKPAAAPAPRRRPAGAENPAIRRMEQELALKQRHHNAALGGGLAEDAARLEREIAVLSARLAVGRELVAAGLADAETATLQKLIDQRMAAAPAAGQDVVVHALPGDAVGAADGGAGRDRTVAALEREAAELRARISSRRAELAAAREKAAEEAAPEPTATAVAVQDAAAQQPAPDATSAPAPAGNDKGRADLEAAQRRDAEASAAAERSGAAVRQVRLELEDARKAAADVARATGELQKLESDRRDLLRRVESLKATLATSVVPVKPGGDAVTVSAAGEDRRLRWMLVAGAAIVVVFSLLMWVSSHGTQSLAVPDRENPFEAPVIGAAPPAGGDDDERPLAV